jgi:glycosyltransferase involved in cell wall biosynthesis
MKPTVTIIMATYNRAHYISEALQSISNQSFVDWECVIIDDGAKDNTLEVVTSFIENDNRFKYIKRTENYTKGLPGCRNCGLDMAKGDFIVFFDDDDFVHPDNLKTSIEILKKNEVDFCHYQKVSFEIEKPAIEKNTVIVQKFLVKSDLEKVIMQKIGLTSCTVMWRKHCFKKIRFNENLFYAEEWECYSRLITENFKGIIIDTVLYYNRKHLNSNTGEFYNNKLIRRESYKEAILVVVQNLNKKQLLSHALLHYFAQQSLGFKECKLFNQILEIIELNKLENFKWQLFYKALPLRLWLFGQWKKIKKLKNA